MKNSDQKIQTCGNLNINFISVEKRDLGKIKKHSAQKLQSLNINQSGKKASTNLSLVLSFSLFLK